MKCLARTGCSLGSPVKEKVQVPRLFELKGQTAPREKSDICSENAAPAISRHADDYPKGPHNKENRCSPDVLSDDEAILGISSQSEDSGYLSLHTSQIEHGDTETLESCSEKRDPTVTSSSCLPVLKFQEEVCKALALGYRKSQRYDFTVINKVAEKHGLHHVIGKKMGLDQVDILCGLLKKDMKHILTRILGLLGECDLISCKKVSKTWRKIICQDQSALQRCRNAEKTLRDSGASMGSLSRDFCLRRVVFSCVQNVASSTPVHKSSKTLTHADHTLDTPKTSRIPVFHEVAKSLKVHESLRYCRLCSSPARFDSAMQRAVCVRVHCAFDFCTRCQSAYHGSVPCQRGMIRSSSRSQTVPVAGSARSKRSIRRL